jgi:malate dehydrogenase (oxaloacetate-decarboxylating)
VYQHTNKWNTVAVVSDGTRVLGLGDIGPEAGLPVLEGKALIFKYLGAVDAVAIALDTKDPDKIVETVRLLQPGLGGVNLEDISQPKCFRILESLREQCQIPVWHDDQQGTATVTLAGLLNALKVVGKEISEVSIAFIGCGAGNVATSRLMFSCGVVPARCTMVDSKGILHPGRSDLDVRQVEFPEKWKLCHLTNAEGRRGGIEQALRGADVCIALSTPGPDLIQMEWVKAMAREPIVFLCANPVPEMWPWEAKEAGAAVVATGRSDFPNQVNNSLCFPGIFRGTLDVRAHTITEEMSIAAAGELARMAEENGLTPHAIMPTMDDVDVYPRVAAAVAVKAIEQGIARIRHVTFDTEYEYARSMILRARGMVQVAMSSGCIALPERSDVAGGIGF